MKQDRVLLLLLLAGGAWYLYTRQQGLDLSGRPLNPMLAPGNDRLSLVTPSYATSTAGTNVNNLVASLSQAANKIVAAIFPSARGGNAPAQPSPSFAVGKDNPVGPIATTGATPIAQHLPQDDPTLSDVDPFFPWQLGPVVDLSPTTTTVPELAWTLDPNSNYIPPPPGA